MSTYCSKPRRGKVVATTMAAVLQPPCGSPFCRLGTIDPYLAQPLDPIDNIRAQQLDQALAVVRAGIGHHHHHQPQRIDQDMSLEPFDLLVAIRADVVMSRRALDALGGHAAGGGFRLSSQATSFQLVQRLYQRRQTSWRRQCLTST